MALAAILLIVALVLFLCAAFGLSTRVHLGWAGMASLVASMLIAGGTLA